MSRIPQFFRSAIRLGVVVGMLFLCSGVGRAVIALPSGRDLKARLAHATAEKKAPDRLKALADLGENLSLAEIPGALALASSLEELRARAVLHDTVIRRWSELAPADAWADVEKLPEGRGKLELVRVTALAYAKRDPARAATAVAAARGVRSRLEAIAIVAESWAKSDVPAALQWVHSLPAGPAQAAALYNPRFIWVHSDPAAAAEDIRTLPPGDTRKNLTMNIAGEWAARDPQQAIAWARTLQETSEQDVAFSNIAESWADSSPRQAAAFALKLPPSFRATAAVAVVARWATQNPREAADWAIGTRDQIIQTRGIAEVLNVWTVVDPNAAHAWATALEPGTLRDSTLQAYSAAVMEWAPESATAVALEISDAATRWQQVESCLAHWEEVDPPGARHWLEASDLPLENKQQWLALPGHHE